MQGQARAVRLDLSTGDGFRISQRAGPGGACHWKFYIGEVDRIELKHRSQLPQEDYSMEEVQAGFKGLGEKYGNYGTLKSVAKENNVTIDIVLASWAVYRYYREVGYLADNNYVIRKYHEIMTKKIK